MLAFDRSNAKYKPQVKIAKTREGLNSEYYVEYSGFIVYKVLMESRSTQKLDEEAIRLQILDAALARFTNYGFGKTTMAEIASDTSMSAANLYRYFKNKHDIASACAQRCMGEQADLLRDITRNSNLSAAEKLERFILETLRYTYDTSKNQPKISELVETIVTERPDIVHVKLKKMYSLIAEILVEGNSRGDFEIEDVMAMAETVHAATKVFQVPIFMGLHEYPHFEQMAKDVSRLLLNGLNKR